MNTEDKSWKRLEKKNVNLIIVDYNFSIFFYLQKKLKNRRCA